MKRYINEFFKLKCAPDMLALHIFPRHGLAKEITESFAAYNAVLKYLIHPRILSLSGSDVCMIAVGDGCTPRTAGTFAFRSAWQCYSVDPRLPINGWNQIKRLYILSQKIEEVLEFHNKAWLDMFKALVMVCVHSHALLPLVLKSTDGAIGKRQVVAIPCCVPQEIPGKDCIGYQDLDIWSPKNTVKFWRDV